MCPSIKFTRVLSVETDSIDLSSEGDGGCALRGGRVLVIVRGGLNGEGDCPADHLRVGCCPSVETESSSFP